MAPASPLPALLRVIAVGLAVIVVVSWMTGCSGRPARDGAPSRAPADVAQTPDAVPRAEAPSRYGNPREYVVFGRRYRTLPTNAGFEEVGIASWYGTQFHGQRTSSGEPYDMFAMTAAHKTLPVPSYVEVTNLENRRRIVVRVNDRGPFVDGRVIDLSYAAAHRLGMAGAGLARVQVRAVGPEVRMAWADRGATVPPVASVSAPSPGGRVVDRGGLRFVQVGAFAMRENADDLKRRLDREGFSPVRVEPAGTQAGRVYRVRIGPLQNAAMQHDVESRLVAFAHRDFRVVLD